MTWFVPLVVFASMLGKDLVGTGVIAFLNKGRPWWAGHCDGLGDLLAYGLVTRSVVKAHMPVSIAVAMYVALYVGSMLGTVTGNHLTNRIDAWLKRSTAAPEPQPKGTTMGLLSNLAQVIEQRFGYHPPSTPDVATAHEKGRQLFSDVTKELVAVAGVVAPGETRELSLVVTKLEEAAMWFHAHVARNQVAPAVPGAVDPSPAPVAETPQPVAPAAPAGAPVVDQGVGVAPPAAPVPAAAGQDVTPAAVPTPGTAVESATVPPVAAPVATGPVDPPAAVPAPTATA